MKSSPPPVVRRPQRERDRAFPSKYAGSARARKSEVAGFFFFFPFGREVALEGSELTTDDRRLGSRADCNSRPLKTRRSALSFSLHLTPSSESPRPAPSPPHPPILRQRELIYNCHISRDNPPTFREANLLKSAGNPELPAAGAPFYYLCVCVWVWGAGGGGDGREHVSY